jgi:hypothetical protein
VPARTREERLFGAACLKVTLERSAGPAHRSEIYRGALEDLGLTDAEVDAFLAEERPAVERALDARRPR